jgi:hypothetical protein
MTVKGPTPPKRSKTDAKWPPAPSLTMLTADAVEGSSEITSPTHRRSSADAAPVLDVIDQPKFAVNRIAGRAAFTVLVPGCPHVGCLP